MNIKVIILVIIVLNLWSCNSEVFPKKKHLIGSWIEENENFSTRFRIIFKDDLAIFIQNNYVDTFSFRLEKNRDLIFFQSQNSTSVPSGESNHKITTNFNKDELIIYGLHPGVNSVKSTFQKE